MSLPDAVFILGGYKDEYIGNSTDAWISSKIAKFDGDGWVDVGDLMDPRSSHSVINFNGKIMVIGGRGIGNQDKLVIENITL